MAGNSFGKLFNLPVPVPIEAGAISAGAKLYFYETGTTTDMSVYTTPGLLVDHAQPVVADSAGEFAPIYLDPDASVDYKVTLKDSGDVTLWTENNLSPRNSGFDTDTFSVTYGGFSADPAATTATWYRFDRIVNLILPLGTGTSNNTAFTISGLPAAIRPTTAQYCHLPFVEDNAAHVTGGCVAVVSNSNLITIALANAAYSTSGWTNSSTKGILTSGSIWYRLSDT